MEIETTVRIKRGVAPVTLCGGEMGQVSVKLSGDMAATPYNAFGARKRANELRAAEDIEAVLAEAEKRCAKAREVGA